MKLPLAFWFMGVTWAVSGCGSAPIESSGFVPDWGPVEPRRFHKSGPRVGELEDRRGDEGAVSRSDEQIRADLLMSLFADPSVDIFDYRVRVDSGKVTLKGRADGQAESDRAEDLVASVPGVKGIENHLHQGELPRTLNPDAPGGTEGTSQDRSIIIGVFPKHPGVQRTSRDPA